MANDPRNTDFFSRGADLALSMTLQRITQAGRVKPSYVQPSPDITHAPRTFDELMQLSDAQKTLLAAATASGCDAVAYYSPDDAGQMRLNAHIDLYPTQTTNFATTTAFNPNTHDTDEHLRASECYQIPVRDNAGTLCGVVMLHSPKQNYGHVQTVEQAQNAGDMHEPCAARRAKLRMAEHIIEHEAVTLLPEWRRKTAGNAAHNTTAAKQAFFATMREDFIATLGTGTFQANHVGGVADLMTMTIDQTINTPQQKIVGDQQRALMHDITLLHDVGKQQVSNTFLIRQWRCNESEESQARSHYFMGENHNHPLFTYLIMSAYPTEALTAAAHHHGLLRYSDDELQKGMGADYAQYKILTDNVPAEKISPLSHFMRICDVTESITGSVANKPMLHAINQLSERAGYNAKTKTVNPVPTDCHSIDPDYLCMMIDSGLFQAYGRLRTLQTGGWKDPNGAAKYDEAAVNAACTETLAAFHWQERKAEVTARLRQAVAIDPFITQNTPQRSPIL